MIRRAESKSTPIVYAESSVSLQPIQGAGCPSFSALHDYVDANCYGGFCEDEMMEALLDHYGGRGENEGMPDELMDYFNEAQNSIDHWIKEGGIKEVASPTPWGG